MKRYLLLIIVIAAALRLYLIGTNPPSLNWDEISHGYNAYSILKTGKDEWGVAFPSIFRAYGDYKLPAYIYLTAVSEQFFGLTAQAIRLPSVLGGVGTVIFTYLLVMELTKKNRTVSLVASFLVAVEPWSLFLSRGAFEANLSLFFIVSGVYFFLKAFQSAKYLVPSAVLLGFSVWTYNSARIFIPLFVAVLVLIYRKELKALFNRSKKLFAFSGLFFALFMIPMFYQLVNPVGLARYGKVAIINEGAVAKINEARGASGLPQFFNRLVNNKATYFTKEFVKNWTTHYLPDFLFLKGGSHYQFSIPGRGLLYLIDLPFLVLGIIFLLKERSKAGLVLISWFILGAVPSSLTNEAPHVLRAITMLPVPMIISAYGIGKIKRSMAIPVYIGFIVLFTENYLIHYFTDYRNNYSWSWQYGYKEIVQYAKDNSADYDKIVVTKKYGEPHEFFLFFNLWDPVKFREDPNLIRFNQSGWYWVDRFDKFYFVNDWQMGQLKLESGGEIDCLDSKCLLITSPGNIPPGKWSKIETINFLDGKSAFEIYEN